MNRHHGTPSPLVRQGPCDWLFFFIIIVPLLFPSCRPTTNQVAGMTDALPTPCRPVHHLTRSQSSRPTFPSIVGLHVPYYFRSSTLRFPWYLSSVSLVYVP